jgi:hypothetical protein
MRLVAAVMLWQFLRWLMQGGVLYIRPAVVCRSILKSTSVAATVALHPSRVQRQDRMTVVSHPQLSLTVARAVCSVFTAC